MRINTRGLLVAAIALLAVAGVSAQKIQRQDALPAFYFHVQLDIPNAGQQTAFFRSVGGLKMETEVVDYQEGGVTGATRKLAGVTKFANIRLTRAFTGDRSLFDWFANTQKPNPIRVNGRITMFDRHGRRVAGWTFSNGFPVKWEGPDFDAEKNELAIETIEIAHEGLTLVDDNN